MNYEQLETDIVTRLSPLLPENSEVMKLPETDDDLRGKPFIGGRITVMYSGSDYGDPGGNNFTRSTAQVVQLETVMVDVVIQSRFLRSGDDSLHKLIRLVKRSLIGYQPTDCDRLYMRKQKVVDKLDQQDASDLFTCVMEFECTTMSIEEVDDTADDVGAITQIQLTDEYGTVQVPQS